MRDPKRIDGMIERLRALWKAYPDMRLGQLIGNVPPHDSSGKGRRFSHPIQDDEPLRSSAICLDRVTGWK